MDYPLKPGDRVRLTPEGVRCYGGAWPHFVPQGQGGGAPGTVLFAGDRPHKPGAAPRPYFVRWDNGVENSYRVEDLEPWAEAEPLPDNDDRDDDCDDDRDDDAADDGKIIPFGRFQG